MLSVCYSQARETEKEFHPLKLSKWYNNSIFCLLDILIHRSLFHHTNRKKIRTNHIYLYYLIKNFQFYLGAMQQATQRLKQQTSLSQPTLSQRGKNLILIHQRNRLIQPPRHNGYDARKCHLSE